MFFNATSINWDHKFLHVLAGACAAKIMTLIGIPGWLSLEGVFLMAILKELYDRAHGPEPIGNSIFDVGITTLGGVLGIFLI